MNSAGYLKILQTWLMTINFLESRIDIVKIDRGRRIETYLFNIKEVAGDILMQIFKGVYIKL